MTYIFLFIAVAVVVIFIKAKSDVDRRNRKYTSVDEWKNDLKTVWEGNRKITFEYEKFGDDEPEKRTVEVKSVVKDGRGRFYIKGFCNLRKEDRTFKLDSIVSDIRDGRQKHIPELWLEEKLKVSI